jgi:hypothetical protein
MKKEKWVRMDGQTEKNGDWESEDVSDIKNWIYTYLQYKLECLCTELLQK